jgi:hypothetical protein
MSRDHCEVAFPGTAVGIVPTPVAPSYREERSPRPATRDRRDLCCICTYSSECMHRGTPESPKLFCELFDVDVPSLTPHEDGAAEDGGDSLVVGGLCCNCENRKTCTMRMPEGDVWHCEEYR